MARQVRVSMSLTATPYQQPEQAVSGSELTPETFYKVVMLRHSRGGRRSCSRTPCVTISKLFLASLVAVILLIYQCGFAVRGTKRRRYASRKLSDDEAASRKYSGVCGGTGEGTDTLSSSDEEPLTRPSPGVAEPRAVRAPKRGFVEGEGDEREAGPSGFSLPSKKKRFFPAASPVPGSQPLAAEGVQHAQHPLVPAGPSEPSAQRLPAAVSGEGASESSAGATSRAEPEGRPSVEMLAASALLLLQQTPPIGDGSGEELEQPAEEEPQPSTSRASTLGLPSEVVSPGGEPEGSDEAPDGRQPAPGPSDQEGQLQQAGAAAAPMGSDAAPSPGRPASPVVIPADHAFLRLPRLQPGVTFRPINLERTRSRVFASSRPVRLLQEVRVLFAKESLCQEEASALLCFIEELAAHCFHNQRAEVDHSDSKAAVEMLGLRFLILDAIVSFFQVAGYPPPEPWWRDLTSAVPHLYGPPRMPAASLSRDLAISLSSAVATLKTGVRPSDDVLYRTKFKLFCSDRIVRRFRQAGYAPWRADCPDAGGST